MSKIWKYIWSYSEEKDSQDQPLIIDVIGSFFIHARNKKHACGYIDYISLSLSLSLSLYIYIYIYIYIWFDQKVNVDGHERCWIGKLKKKKKKKTWMVIVHMFDEPFFFSNPNNINNNNKGKVKTNIVI